MKKLLVLVLMLSVIQTAYANHVRGYYRKDGTFVNGYNRTRPNSTKFDNYSTRGNFNPYTGKTGTTNPYLYPRTRRFRSYNKF